MLCTACDHRYEEVRPISKPGPTSCPQCGALPPEFGQTYEVAPHGHVKEIRTLGQQSDLNFKRLGKEKSWELYESLKPRQGFDGKLVEGAKVVEKTEETPWFRNGEVEGTKKLDKPLDVKKVKDIQNYVITGETK